MTSIWVVTAAAIVFAIVSVENAIVLFANALASLFATPTPPDDTGQSRPINQSTADAQALPPAASEAPTGGEIAVASKTADQGQTEIPQPPAEVLLNKFQTWAAEEDARAQVRPEQNAQPQDRSVQDARAPARPVQDAQPPAQPPGFLQSLGWRN